MFLPLLLGRFLSTVSAIAALDTGVGPGPIVDMGAFEHWVPRRAHVRSHP